MFAEDLSPFFDTATGFATSATVGGQSVAVVFDAAYTGALAGLVESTGPQAICSSADVAARSIVHGTAITINGTPYTVTGVQPDGTGLTTLQLRG